MSPTKSQIIEAIAGKPSVEKKSVEAMLGCLARLAYENAKPEFTVPGIGKRIVVDRQARTARNPRTGAEIKVPAKKALKFRLAKAAKDAILGGLARKRPSREHFPSESPSAGLKQSHPGARTVRVERDGRLSRWCRNLKSGRITTAFQTHE